jgi:hypothetical protein
LFERFRWFWDLTCDFWAENAKRKTKGEAKAIKSVASPFGLRFSLRQSGMSLRGWLDAGLKPRSLPKTEAKTQKQKTKAEANLF